MTEKYLKDWRLTQVELLHSKTKNYSDLEKENIKLSYLLKVIEVGIFKIKNQEEVKEIMTKVEEIITMLPEKISIDGKISYKKAYYLKKIGALQSFIKIKYKYTDEKTIRSDAYLYSFLLGVAIGPLIGAIAGQVVLGVCFGIPIGLTFFRPLIKKRLMNRAIKEDRLL